VTSSWDGSARVWPVDGRSAPVVLRQDDRVSWAELSRDGRRVYVTNSLFRTWDDQFYPDGIRGWMAKVDVPSEGGLRLDRDFFVDYGDRRAHQVRLEGGDASSDSYCFPS